MQLDIALSHPLACFIQATNLNIYVTIKISIYLNDLLINIEFSFDLEKNLENLSLVLKFSYCRAVMPERAAHTHKIF